MSYSAASVSANSGTDFRRLPWCRRVLLSLARLWLGSCRIRWESVEPPPGSVIALWHQDLPASLAIFAHRNISVLISASQDGVLFGDLARSLGYQVFHGSSNRLQQSVRHLLRALRLQRSVGMALDGPRGPALIEKPGARWLADQAAAPLFRTEVRYSHFFSLNRSWDKTRIPLPCSVLHVKMVRLAMPFPARVKG